VYQEKWKHRGSLEQISTKGGRKEVKLDPAGYVEEIFQRSNYYSG